MDEKRELSEISGNGIFSDAAEYFGFEAGYLPLSQYYDKRQDSDCHMLQGSVFPASVSGPAKELLLYFGRKRGEG